MLNSKQPPWPKPANRWYQQSVKRTKRLTKYRRKICDQPYGEDPAQQLDIYLPDCWVRGPLPVVVFVHGGYFTNGDRLIAGHMAKVINELSAIFVTVGYRLAPAASLQQQIDDVARATAWVNRHIHDYGGDNQCIVLAGHSSGGHLTAMIALQRERLELHGIPFGALRACMPISGVYDLLNTAPRVSRFIIRQQQDIFAYSPVFQVHADTAPMLLTVSEGEFVQLRDAHDLFYSKLQSVEAPVSELVLPDCDHFSVTFFNQASNPWLQALSEYLDLAQPTM